MPSRRNKQQFEPKIHELHKLVSVEHPKDRHAPVEVFAIETDSELAAEHPETAQMTEGEKRDITAYKTAESPAGMVRISNNLFYRDARKRGVQVERLDSLDPDLEKKMLEGVFD